MMPISMLDYYKMASELGSIFKRNNPDFVYSVFIYGSVSRFEVIPGLSDLDVMVIVDVEYFNETQIKILNSINNAICNNYPIHCNFRIRNKKDLYEKRSGIRDYNPTAILNYVRDGICIFRNDMDFEFYDYLKKVNEKDINMDFFILFSEFRLRLRALISLGENNKNISTNKDKEDSIFYEIGDLICNLAEWICYFNGIPFFSKIEALNISTQLTGESLFLDAIDVKKGKAVPQFHYIAKLDSIFNDYQKKKASDFYNILDKLEMREETVLAKNDLLTLFREKLSDEMLLVELADIFSGKLPFFKMFRGNHLYKYICKI